MFDVKVEIIADCYYLARYAETISKAISTGEIDMASIGFAERAAELANRVLNFCKQKGPS